MRTLPTAGVATTPYGTLPAAPQVGGEALPEHKVGLTQRPLGPMVGRSVMRPTALLTPRSITPRAGVRLRTPRPRSVSRCALRLMNSTRRAGVGKYKGGLAAKLVESLSGVPLACNTADTGCFLAGLPAQVGTMRRAWPALQPAATAAMASRTRGACLCGTRCQAQPAQAHPQQPLPLGSLLARVTATATGRAGPSMRTRERSSLLAPAVGASRCSSQTAAAAAATPAQTSSSMRTPLRLRKALNGLPMATALLSADVMATLTMTR